MSRQILTRLRDVAASDFLSQVLSTQPANLTDQIQRNGEKPEGPLLAVAVGGFGVEQRRDVGIEIEAQPEAQIPASLFPIHLAVLELPADQARDLDEHRLETPSLDDLGVLGEVVSVGREKVLHDGFALARVVARLHEGRNECRHSPDEKKLPDALHQFVVSLRSTWTRLCPAGQTSSQPPGRSVDPVVAGSSPVVLAISAVVPRRFN